MVKRLVAVACISLLTFVAIVLPVRTIAEPLPPALPLTQSLTVVDYDAAPTTRDSYIVKQMHYHEPLACPLRVTSDMGQRARPTRGASTNHPGTDYVCAGQPDWGVPALAIANGTVTGVVNSRWGKGTVVTISHYANGESFTSLYAHLVYGSPTVAVGQEVIIGQHIAAMGNTGVSTGTHLHLEINLGGTLVSASDFFNSRRDLTLPIH